MIDGTPSAEQPLRPRLRSLEVHHHVEGGRRGIVVSDPLAVARCQCFIPEALLGIVGRFDGDHSIAEIEAAVRAQGVQLRAGLVTELVDQLEEALLLDSPRARAAEAAACGAFLAGDGGARPARHAGSAGYPDDPARLRASLDAIVPARKRAPAGRLRGLIAPHIDLRRGAAGYRAAYGKLAEHEPADLYVLFGTGHKGPSAPVTGLPLDWQTPIGRVPTDRGFVAAVHRRLGEPAARDLLLHRDEHSIEFQVLMLAHALRGHRFEVAGFLCGELPSAQGDPSTEAYVQAVLRAFTAASAASGKRVCFVAGADLAHLGPFFGTDPPVDGARLQRLEDDDRARLAHVKAGAPGTFHRSVVAGGNPDRICGATPMYLCAALARGPAELLHYGQAHAADGSQVVSFCAMAIGG